MIICLQCRKELDISRHSLWTFVPNRDGGDAVALCGNCFSTMAGKQDVLERLDSDWCAMCALYAKTNLVKDDFVEIWKHVVNGSSSSTVLYARMCARCFQKNFGNKVAFPKIIFPEPTP